MRTRRARVVIVPNAEASDAIRSLHRRGLMDPTSRIVRDGHRVSIPVIEDVEGSTMGWADVPVRELTDPHDALDAIVPPEMRDLVPRRWELLGDVAVVKLGEGAAVHAREIGAALASALGVRTVCWDRSGISGELRVPDVEVIHGHGTVTEKVENGVVYRMDVAKVMFSSGNVDERTRMGRVDCTGETVLDMFAGIGYFTLPIAVHGNASEVIACEKNPDSFRYLEENVRINDVQDVVTPVLGDNRELELERPVDRLIMGYVGGTSLFLEKGLGMVRPGGVVHFHDTFASETLPGSAIDAIRSVCPGARVDLMRRVKSYSPGVDHVVVDITMPE